MAEMVADEKWKEEESQENKVDEVTKPLRSKT